MQQTRLKRFEPRPSHRLPLGSAGIAEQKLTRSKQDIWSVIPPLTPSCCQQETFCSLPEFKEHESLSPGLVQLVYGEAISDYRDHSKKSVRSEEAARGNDSDGDTFRASPEVQSEVRLLVEGPENEDNCF